LAGKLQAGNGIAPGDPAPPAEQAAAELYEALAAGERARITELLHPDFVGRTAEGMPLGLGRTYQGPDAMYQDFWAQIGRHFEAARAEPAEFSELPDGRLLVTGRYRGRARASGGLLDAEFAHLLTFADGRIARLVQLTDTAQWAAALAVAPDAADAAAPGHADAGARSGGAGRDAPAGAASQQRPRPFGAVTLDVTDGLGVLRLDRPATRNAIDEALVDDLADAVQRCAADPALRALLICAAGPAFTVGGDVALFAGTSPADLPGDLRRMTTVYHAALRHLDDLPVPVVAAVHGAVAGGGLGLIYVADIVIAAEGTKFATGFANLALSGDGGSSWFLPRLVGARRAAELYFGQRVLDAAEAAEWGLVSRVVPAARLQDEAAQAARELADGPTRALGEIRALLRHSPTATLGDQLVAETQALARTAGTRDAAHAIESFMAKTRPEFRGW
jgi:2-(1,2-epoxy-1,2-dihydrophenyl)acetyl-CoA isomerase